MLAHMCLVWELPVPLPRLPPPASRLMQRLPQTQDDMCLWNLTVRETVMFAAKLRLPQSTPETEKDNRVTELVELLGLSHIADSIVGKEGRRGISGGERKRVSIGVELITSPDVLFLDEPTSGLGKFRGRRRLARVAVRAGGGVRERARGSQEAGAAVLSVRGASFFDQL